MESLSTVAFVSARRQRSSKSPIANIRYLYNNRRYYYNERIVSNNKTQSRSTFYFDSHHRSSATKRYIIGHPDATESLLLDWPKFHANILIMLYNTFSAC